MANSSKQFGSQAESIAADYLKKHGYRILCRNWRCRLGEIDIIAEERDTLVFVEVKSRKSGNPKWAVTPKKQKKISMIALWYLKDVGRLNERARFDVVAVYGQKPFEKIELIQNAFDFTY
jgi:putative endonuclease